MTTLRRDDGQLLSEPYYKTILDTESHHDHEIIIDSHGVIRWKENEQVVAPLLQNISLNSLIMLFNILGITKNSEEYRALYRHMGYSLSGYWEIFYWELNNEDADEYNPCTH